MTDSAKRAREREDAEARALAAAIDLDGGEERLRTADGKDLLAVLMGRRGGLKGGKARAENLSAERRSQIAVKAAQARWVKAKGGN